MSQVSNAKATRHKMERLLSVDEVGEFLGIPVKTLYQWRHKSAGPKAYRVSRHFRYEPSTLWLWVDEHWDRPRGAGSAPRLQRIEGQAADNVSGAVAPTRRARGCQDVSTQGRCRQVCRHDPGRWNDRTLFTFEEFCDLMRTPQRTVRDWRWRGDGPRWAHLDGCRRLYITVAATRCFVLSATHTAAVRVVARRTTEQSRG